MEARQEPDGTVVLRMSLAEAVVLQETIAFSEWSNELEAIELKAPVEQKTVSEVQQALAPVIPGLGTEAYQSSVDAAYAEVDPAPF